MKNRQIEKKHSSEYAGKRKWCKRHQWMVLAYGESQYLEECVQSLLEQTVRSSVIITTSTPNKWISSIAEKYHLPVLVNTGTAGITQDWNYAMGQAQAPYVTFAHQDDVYERDYAEQAVRALKRAKSPLLYFSDYYEIRNGKKIFSNRNLRIKRMMLLPLRSKCLQNSRFVRRRILSFGSPVCCPAVTYVRGALPSPVFDECFRVAQDWEAWERLSRLEGAFVFDPQPRMGHRIHEDSTTTELIADETRSKEELMLFQRFWPQAVARRIERYYQKGQDSNCL